MRTTRTAVLGLSALLLTAACSSATETPSGTEASPIVPSPGTTDFTATTVTVTTNDDGCELSSERAEPGPLTFAVTNKGAETSSFVIYGGPAKETVVAQVEAVEAGETVDASAVLDPGDYVVDCVSRPGDTPTAIGFTVGKP